ncbi:prephenate dehydrogenase [Luteimicrobium album]|uniref:prephenate dehydrogenase n=1 Tax=Luteimicrobium album TaxID=1054550 RepID=UPI0024E11BFC|nr:prephenate dehydrogenase/arogenate dehydrogenase family protein [Luteimicrobium album]
MTRVGVVGLGLIGGSVARTLVAAGVDVVATDPDGATRAQAWDAGVRTVGSAAEVLVERPDVLVLAPPLAALPAVLAELAAELPRLVADGGPLPVLTDVGSVKAPVRAAARVAGLEDRYVGAHPMAGTEESGFAASRDDLLPGCTWAVTVAPTTAAGDLLRVLALIAGPLRGVARVVEDATHDAAVALVSHVPHVLATELLNLTTAAPARALALGLAAGSFRDGTRVARTDPRRTQAMVAGNADAVVGALRDATRHLDALADALEGGDDAAVTAFFDAADPVRAALAEAAAGDASPRTETVALGEPGWRERLVSLGAAGAVVARTGRDAITLAVPPPSPK